MASSATSPNSTSNQDPDSLDKLWAIQSLPVDSEFHKPRSAFSESLSSSHSEIDLDADEGLVDGDQFKASQIIDVGDDQIEAETQPAEQWQLAERYETPQVKKRRRFVKSNDETPVMSYINATLRLDPNQTLENNLKSLGRLLK